MLRFAEEVTTNKLDSVNRENKLWMGGGGGYAFPYLNFPNQPPVNNRGIVNYFRGVVYAACQRDADRISQTRLALYDSGRKKSGPKSKAHGLDIAKSFYLYKHTAAKNYARDPTGITEVESHPALDLVRRPNPYLTERQYRKYDRLFSLVTGVSYKRLMWFGDEPIQRWILPPHAVVVTTDPFTGLPVTFNYMGEDVPLKDMLVQTTDNLLDPYGVMPGVSAVRSVMDKLRLHDFITEKLSALMSAPKFSGILSPKGEDNVLSPEQEERWMGKLEQFRHGRQGDILFLDAESQFTGIMQNPTDLAAVEIIKQIRQDVAMAFSQPMMLLSGSEGNSRASYGAAVQEWMDTAVQPSLRELEDHLNQRFLPLFRKHRGTVLRLRRSDTGRTQRHG